MTRDLTVGKPSKVLLGLSLPMFISVLFQQMYNLADSVMAGQFAGENALAAVGASYPVTMIFMAVAFGFNIGSSVVISQLFGAKKFAETKTSVWTAAIMSLVISVVMTVFGVLCSSLMMQWINTPADIMADGAVYLKIYAAGLVFLFMYNTATAVFMALGDTRTPLVFLIASSLLNILLDYIFVAPLNMGVAGVAWATFIAQGVACIGALAALAFVLHRVKTEEKYKKFSWAMSGKILKISLPSILQQSFISIGNIAVQSVVNTYGNAVIAGFSAGTKLNTFAMTSMMNLANGVSTFTAQNYGAGEYDRIKKGFKAAIGYIYAVALPFVLLFCLGGEFMMKMFVADISDEALATGMTMVRIISPFYFVCSFKLLADGVLRGSGAMVMFMISTFSDLIIRVALSYAWSPAVGMTAVFWAWPIGWAVGTVISLLFYFSGKWKKRLPRKSDDGDDSDNSDNSDSNDNFGERHRLFTWFRHKTGHRAVH